MSRIGKLPIELPTGIEVEIKENTIHVKGKLGELSLKFNNTEVSVKKEENVITVTRNNDGKKARSCHGLYRTLISNMITGVNEGYEKKLEINGVGYKAALQGTKLVLQLGFSHPIEVESPEGIEFILDEKKKNSLSIKGIDKQKVGQAAANIRKHRPPEPYKGKGIKYEGEYIRRKVGKAAGKE